MWSAEKDMTEQVSLGRLNYLGTYGPANLRLHLTFLNHFTPNSPVLIMDLHLVRIYPPT